MHNYPFSVPLLSCSKLNIFDQQLFSFIQSLMHLLKMKETWEDRKKKFSCFKGTERKKDTEMDVQ